MKLRVIAFLCLVAATLMWAQTNAPKSESAAMSDQVILISGGTLIDGTGSAPVRDSLVVVRGDRIVAAGSRAKVKVPAQVDRRIDATGKWIIPGLIDAHVHFFQSGGLYTRPDVIDLRAQVPYAKEIARIKERLPYTFSRYLCSGITSVDDVGGPMWNFEVREIASRTAEAPRVHVAGPLISTYAPPALATEDPAIIKVNTPEEARALVRKELQHKPDLIKIWYIVEKGQKASDSFGLVKAAVDESHKAHVRVAVHATQLETATEAVKAGADILVHSVDDAPVTPDFVRMVKERGVIYTTTFVVYEGYAKVLAKHATLTDIDRQCGDPDVIATWNDMKPSPKLEDVFADEKTRLKTMQANLVAMEKAGVTVAAGTDAGNIGTLHGPDLHREFELMSEAGLTPMQILVSATRDAAKVGSAKPEVGTLEPGKFADLVILDADPLADIKNARRIDTVIKGGQIFPESQLVSKPAQR